ncbi:hypothetical protein HHX47_DHR1000301 [Lentinula edodes]|nr:hypothetical protein HHX47_DHR1000301 [Lentinula edodes]
MAECSHRERSRKRSLHLMRFVALPYNEAFSIIIEQAIGRKTEHRPFIHTTKLQRTYRSYWYVPRRALAFDQRVLASVCFFATDVHSATLGKGKSDDTLIRVRNGDLTGKGELVDTHVPRAGRDLIRTTLDDANVTVSFLEVQAQHAFIRDESSKGRWDAALTRSLFSFMMEVFDRTIGVDLGPLVDDTKPLEHVC